MSVNDSAVQVHTSAATEQQVHRQDTANSAAKQPTADKQRLDLCVCSKFVCVH
jgi:hypothetical protein